MYKKELFQLEHDLAETEFQDDKELEKELAQLERDEAILDRELKSIDEQEKSMEDHFEVLKSKKNDIEKHEQEIWEKLNDYEKEHIGQLEECQQTRVQTANMEQLYKRFKRTNFLNEVFNISSQDHFGTISGFRLGRIN